MTTVSDTSATLHWTNVEDVADYAVRLDGAIVISSLGSVSNYTFISSDGFTRDTAHRLGVASVRDGVRSDFSELKLLVSPVFEDPSRSEYAITLRWGVVTDADSYGAARVAASAACAEATVEHQIVEGLPPLGVRFEHAFSIPASERGARHKLCVRARNAQGSSAWAAVTDWTKLAAPTNVAATDLTSDSASLSWDAVTHATAYEWKAVTASDCNGAESRRTVTATSTPVSLDQPETEYRFCVRAVQTLDGETRRSDWAFDTGESLAAVAPLMLVNASTSAAYCVRGASDAVPVAWVVTGGTAPYLVDGESFANPRGTVQLDRPQVLGRRTVSAPIEDSSDDAQSVTAAVAVTLVAPISFSLDDRSLSCEVGEELSVDWRLSGGSGSYTVSIPGESAMQASTGRDSAEVDCPATTGTHFWTITASDRNVPDLDQDASLTVTVTEPPPLLSLVSATTSAQYCVQGASDAVPVAWVVTGGTAPYLVDGESFANPRGTVQLDCPQVLGRRAVSAPIEDSSDDAQSVTAAVAVTVVAPISFSLDDRSLSCEVGEELSVGWRLSGGSGSYRVSIPGASDVQASTGRDSAEVDCPGTTGTPLLDDHGERPQRTRPRPGRELERDGD